MAILNSFSRFILPLVSFALISCGSGGGGGGDASTQQEIFLSPSDRSVLVGSTVALTAMKKNPDGTSSEIDNWSDIAWASSNTSVISIETGMKYPKAKAISEGISIITATYNGSTCSATLTVKSINNKIILYIASSSDASQFFSNYDILVESDVQKIIRYVPDESLADVIATNRSYSYAQSNIYPYTIDGRLFVRTDVRPYEYSGHHSYSEYNPLNNNIVLNFGVYEPNSTSSYRYTISGNTYYYRESRTYDYLYGDSGGDFKKITISNGMLASNVPALLSYSDVDNFSDGSLHSSNGTIYDSRWYLSRINYSLDLYKRNLTTGKIDTLSSKTFLFAPQYQTPKICFDNNTAYISMKNETTGEIEIWKYDFINDISISKIFNKIIDGINSVDYLDVSNGHLAIGDGDGYIMLYDIADQIFESGYIGLNFYFLQILYIK